MGFDFIFHGEAKIRNKKNHINKNKVLYERKFNFQLDPNNHKLENLIIISVLLSLMKAKRI